MLVLTRGPAIEVMAKVLAVPATTTIRDIPSEVALSPADGVAVDCVLSLDNVAPVRKAYLTRKLATLTPTRMAEVCRALRDATDC